MARVKKPGRKKSEVARRSPADSNRERTVEKARRMREAYEMRKAGASYDMIAERLHYSSAQSAANAVKRFVQRVETETAGELRTLGNERLNSMLMVAYSKALKGDLQAMDRVLRIQSELDARNGVQDSSSGNVNVGQAVIVVGGTEQEYVQALQDAAARQQQHNAQHGVQGALPASTEDWDAWDAHDAADDSASPVAQGPSPMPDDIIDAEVIDDDAA